MGYPGKPLETKFGGGYDRGPGFDKWKPLG